MTSRSVAAAGEEARESVRAGSRFAWLFGERTERAPLLHYVVRNGAELEDRCAEVRGAVPSIADSIPAAVWHEREASERFGFAFDGVPSQTSLLAPADPSLLRTNRSEEVSTVLYGPVRSGIVESACWVVETAGEDFLRVTPSMFYKRREIEERFSGRSLDAAVLLAEHVSGATAVSHASAFAAAAEQALGTCAPQRALAARAALLEFERLHQHLDVLAKLADDASLSVGSSQAYAVKERIHRLLVQVTGSRFSRSVVRVGGLRFDAIASLQAVWSELDRLQADVSGVVDELFATQSLIDRLIGTGHVGSAVAQSHAAVGPVARASGIACDVRIGEPGFRAAGAAEALQTGGDALARALVRRFEIQTSFHLIRALVDSAPNDGFYTAPSARDGCAMAAVESPQGELLYFVRFAKGLTNVAIRSASYQNWPLFSAALAGNIFTDFSFVEHSFGLLQSEVDR